MRELKPTEVECSSLKDAIRLVPQKNAGAFELVYRTHGTLVYRLCLRMLRNPIEAEDAAQDVFVHVLRKMHTFRGESAFSSWLYRVTINFMIMRLRKQKQNWPSVAQSEDRGGHCSDIYGADHGLRGILWHIDLETAVKLLPEGYKAAFILHDVEGYEHKEISQILGYSIGTSKSQLHRARKRLRNLLSGVTDEGVREDTALTPGCVN